MILRDRKFEFLRILEPVIYLSLSEELEMLQRGKDVTERLRYISY